MDSSSLSNFNGLGFLLTFFFGVLIFVLQRRLAFMPIVLSCLYLTLGQQVIIFGANFTAVRIIIVLGLMRLIIRKEFSSFKINNLDRIFLIWIGVRLILYTILHGTFDAFINRVGQSVEYAGSYFLFRCSIRDLEDAVGAIKILSLSILPLALIMIFESQTGKNLFSHFSAVPELSQLRDPDKISAIISKVRCQGPFRHPILAGTLGATLFPLFCGLWRDKSSRVSISVGLLSSAAIALVSASSGPLLSFLGAIIAISFWFFREKMRIVRRLLALMLIALHFYMKAPVWYLMARLGELIGGTGWHRSYLIEQAFKHISEWWLIGTTVTAHWMPINLPIDPDQSDITNNYIGEGIHAGLLTLVIFIYIIIVAFRYVGNGRKALSENAKFYNGFVVWTFGASLFAHVLSFLSVSYFDQSRVLWSFIIALISCINLNKFSDNA